MKLSTAAVIFLLGGVAAFVPQNARSRAVKTGLFGMAGGAEGQDRRSFVTQVRILRKSNG
jgi:hypothetical protein